MSTNKKDQNTATVEEVAKALGMRADFVAAAEMTPIERLNAVCDVSLKAGLRAFTLSISAIGLAVAGASLLLDLHPSSQLDPVDVRAVSAGLLCVAFCSALLNQQIPCPRTEITNRAQENMATAYLALKQSLPPLARHIAAKNRSPNP